MAAIPASGIPTPTASHDTYSPRKFPCRSLRGYGTDAAFSGPASSSVPRRYLSLRCRCSKDSRSVSPDGDSSSWRWWESTIGHVMRSVVKRWEDYVRSCSNSSLEDEIGNADAKKEDEGEFLWDWEKWSKHFVEVEEQERLVAILKSQLSDAVSREDYEEAGKLYSVITAAESNNSVGAALSDVKMAIAEERYCDATYLRDHAGVGLVGWWSGVAVNPVDPFGRIIHISAEHGRYVARSYSARHLSSDAPGLPVFEIFFSSRKGKHIQQAVYLKHNKKDSGDCDTRSSENAEEASSTSKKSPEGQNESLSVNVEAIGNRDDISDTNNQPLGFESGAGDVIPGFKIKVLKVVSPGETDKDLISEVIEHIMEEVDDDDDDSDDVDGDEEEFELVEVDDSITDSENVELMVVEDTNMDADEQQSSSMKVVIGSLMEDRSTDMPSEDLVRIPAKLERKGRHSLLFSAPQDDEQNSLEDKEKASRKALAARRSIIVSELKKAFLRHERIPHKVIEEVGNLISSSLSQDQKCRSFSGTTIFNRIDVPSKADPLNGLYIGAHGMHTSEIIHLKRKWGQWKEDEGPNKDIEFYEYVEALQLIGGFSIPAGQVAFRAKVGKRNELPHEGIIPEEFGVVARYKGRGRIIDPISKKPRWVDGELVILDGKIIKHGPIIGFVYWAPKYHFLVFFNRLSLPY